MTRAIWVDAGCPEVAKPTRQLRDVCALCGREHIDGKGVPVGDAFGVGFTDWDKLSRPSADGVCVACVWLMGRNPPATLRLWSVLYREDWVAPPSNPKAAYPVGPKTWLTSKADMSRVIETLLDPPDCEWVCSIADSGQIHTLPFARVNGAGPWVVRFERADVHSSPEQFATVLFHVSSLLVAGFTREDIFTLDPHPSKLVKHGVAVWRRHADPLRPYRRSHLLQLVVTLTRKETYEDTQGRADRVRGTARARDDEQRNDGEDIASRLVAASEGSALGSDRPSDKLGPTHRGHEPEAANHRAPQRVRQGDLFLGFGR